MSPLTKTKSFLRKDCKKKKELQIGNFNLKKLKNADKLFSHQVQLLTNK